VLKIFMAHGCNFIFSNIAIFLVNWICLTYITSGTAVPCGIFLPCMLIGCALGHVYHPVHIMITPYRNSEDCINAETVAILGAAAVLSGATRMTFCLVVIMLETTSNIDLFLPVIFTIFTSYGMGFVLMPRSIYKGALRSKNIPILNKSLPKQNRKLLAANIMSAPPIHFSFLASVEQVLYQLESTPYNGFPVVNSRSQPIGIVERDVLITLIRSEAWYQLPEGIYSPLCEAASPAFGQEQDKEEEERVIPLHLQTLHKKPKGHSTRIITMSASINPGEGGQQEDGTEDFSSPLEAPLHTEVFNPNQNEADYDENDVDA
jgi:hypothetical protein